MIPQCDRCGARPARLKVQEALFQTKYVCLHCLRDEDINIVDLHSKLGDELASRMLKELRKK